MSVPPPYSQRNVTEHKEDCRDYLRTGRCKYGASCKYNHPPNVQSGGGMKAPIDPSEPMFPIRPNEPVCQYFMKHGTCKFGQTCKFHHPPQSSIATTLVNGNTILMSVGRKNDGQQILWNHPGGDAGVQLLPQRPDEPNCIFFLKNGRCKYGATCRYHHPLNFHDRRQGDDGRRQQIQAVSPDMPLHSSKIHYVTSMPSKSYQHGHFVVSEGAVTFVSLDGSSPAQVISVPQSSGNNDGGGSYMPQVSSSMTGPMGGLNREVASSSSSASIASSYDTAGSSADPLAPHGDTSGGLWNRPKRSGSGSSLNVYNVLDPNGRPHMMTQGNRAVLVQGAGDANMSMPHVSALGNTGDTGTVYYDANPGHNRTGASQLQQNNGTNAVQWRGKRSSSFDHTRQVSTGHYNQAGDIHKSTSVPEALGDQGAQQSPMNRGGPPVTGHRSQRRPQQTAEVDDGLSMMTSALLTLIDTPEDVAVENYGSLDTDDQRGSSSQSSTPRMRPQYAPSVGLNNLPPNSQGATLNYESNTPYMPSPTFTSRGDPIDEHVLGLMPVDREVTHSHFSNHDPSKQKNQSRPNEESPSWSPTWQGSTHMTRPLQENGQSVPVMQPQSSSNSPHAPSHVGLYLL